MSDFDQLVRVSRLNVFYGDSASSGQLGDLARALSQLVAAASQVRGLGGIAGQLDGLVIGFLLVVAVVLAPDPPRARR